MVALAATSDRLLLINELAGGRYNENPNYFGGIVAFTRHQFIKINGFPNTFWGCVWRAKHLVNSPLTIHSHSWGGEDNELYSRVRRTQQQVQTPTSYVAADFLGCRNITGVNGVAACSGSITDLEELDLASKLAVLRSSDWKCYVRRVYRWSGQTARTAYASCSQIKRQLLKEHHKTWRCNGLRDLQYELVDAVSLSADSTKFTVELFTNDHWSDAHAPLSAAVPSGS